MTEKSYVPTLTEEQKIASINSSIESLVKMLIQELNKRRVMKGVEKMIVSITVEEEIE
jgi:urease gamma subunit